MIPKPQNNDPVIIGAAKEYKEIWKKEGSLILKAIKEISGLDYQEKGIIAIIYEGPSSSGKIGEPMKLRASYDSETKKGTLIHELYHRLMINVRTKDSLEEHKKILPYVYKTWTALYGKGFANRQVEIEKQRGDVYKKAWNYTLKNLKMKKQSKILIRKPKMSDAYDLFVMVNGLIEEKAFISIQKKVTVEQEEAYLKSIIGSKETFDLVLVVDGRVMGIAGVEKGISIKSHQGSIGILVSKEVRGRGLGRKLFKEVMEKGAKKMKLKIITLDVFVKNKIAQGLYKKMGFKKIATIKGGASYYGGYEDEFSMIKYL